MINVDINKPPGTYPQRLGLMDKVAFKGSRGNIDYRWIVHVFDKSCKRRGVASVALKMVLISIAEENGGGVAVDAVFAAQGGLRRAVDSAEANCWIQLRHFPEDRQHPLTRGTPLTMLFRG